MKPPLRVPANGLAPGPFELDAETSRYVGKVHRIRVGDDVLLFDPESGREARGTVTNVRADSVLLDVGELSDGQSLALPLTLLQALGKGDKPEQGIRDATVLGACRVVLLQTERTIVRPGKDDRADRYRKVAVEAARQSGRSDLPRITGPLDFSTALHAEQSKTKLVCAWHPSARPILSALAEWDGLETLAILIGPEGGLSASELDAALQIGFAAVSLGPLVLRTETAATVAMGIVAAHAELLRSADRR